MMWLGCLDLFQRRHLPLLSCRGCAASIARCVCYMCPLWWCSSSERARGGAISRQGSVAPRLLGSTQAWHRISLQERASELIGVQKSLRSRSHPHAPAIPPTATARTTPRQQSSPLSPRVHARKSSVRQPRRPSSQALPHHNNAPSNAMAPANLASGPSFDKDRIALYEGKTTPAVILIAIVAASGGLLFGGSHSWWWWWVFALIQHREHCDTAQYPEVRKPPPPSLLPLPRLLPNDSQPLTPSPTPHPCPPKASTTA